MTAIAHSVGIFASRPCAGFPSAPHHSVWNVVTTPGEVGPDPGSGGGLRCGRNQLRVVAAWSISDSLFTAHHRQKYPIVKRSFQFGKTLRFG